jgi:hypothetical protein
VSHQYSVFGLLIRSNFPIPELSTEALSNRAPDLSIHWQMRPDTIRSDGNTGDLTYVSAYADQAGAPALKIWSLQSMNLLRLEYSDGAEFWVDRAGTGVWAVWPESLSIEDTATYFLGPVLGLVLRLRGVTCLHASAMAFGERAAAFVGSEGAGKSTTAAALARKGFVAVSDDIVALEERGDRFFVKPAYPYLCLWPESVKLMYGSADALPRFAEGYDKRCLSLERESLAFAAGPVPLACLYILGERATEAAPRIESVPPQEAFVTLVANTYATNMLDSAMRAREFEVLGRLMQRVEVRRVRAHSDPSRIEELCSLLQNDVETIP